jgi:hypothetical protein
MAFHWGQLRDGPFEVRPLFVFEGHGMASKFNTKNGEQDRRSWIQLQYLTLKIVMILEYIRINRLNSILIGRISYSVAIFPSLTIILDNHIWLVVWNHGILWCSIQLGISSSQLTTWYFSEGVETYIYYINIYKSQLTIHLSWGLHPSWRGFSTTLRRGQGDDWNEAAATPAAICLGGKAETGTTSGNAQRKGDFMEV